MAGGRAQCVALRSAGTAFEKLVNMHIPVDRSDDV